MRKKKSSSSIIVLVILIFIVAALAYLYNSKMFERGLPHIELEKSINWNLKKPIKVKISDQSGIKFIRATLSDGKNSIVLDKKVFSTPQEDVTLDIEFPRRGFISSKTNFELSVEAVDASKWNFFSGNENTKQAIIHVDTKRPELFIINNSYKIIKGGAAAVVFKASDKNLKELYIETNFGKKFMPTPFYKEGFYISLLAWPNYEKKFDGTIVAKDKAGNISKMPIRFYLKNKRYRTSKIKLSDSFIEGKITDLIEVNGKNPEELKKAERFKFINEELRKANEELIETITSKVPQELIKGFKINTFYPLKNAAAVASFGDHRFYQYQGETISESYHLGLDFASTAQAKIVSSNPGKVVYARYNGIYGENIIISHGLGVYSLYGHCSSYLVNEGESVKAGDVIATTGKTGLALGDHLHFGTIVQGVEVRPEEWMDRDWLNDNIFGVINAAKKIIDR